MATTITIDFSRGIDVMRGPKLVEHFEGAGAYEAAKRCAAEGRGRYLRYWAVKPAEGE